MERGGFMNSLVEFFAVILMLFFWIKRLIREREVLEDRGK